MAYEPFGFLQLAGEIILLEFRVPFPHDNPAAEPRNISIPHSVPHPPSRPEVMEVKEEHRERKDLQSDSEQVLETVETAHDLEDGSLHLVRGHRGIRNEEGEVAVIVFPAEGFLRKDPVLPAEPTGQVSPRKWDREKDLDGVDFGLPDEFPEIPDPLLCQHPKLSFGQGIAEYEHAMNPKPA